MSSAEEWRAWEGRVVGGKFPLRTWLGGSDHSAIFLTEQQEKPSRKAAIKLIPADAEAWCRPEVVLKFGEPVRQILETAREKDADLIVMGTHGAAGHVIATTHLERGVSYSVVVRSRCPVLTVRG